MRKLCTMALLLTMALWALVPLSAHADVRFGKNVRIGGHDFSNQTYNHKRRAIIRLYDHRPPHEGCVWRRDGLGGRVKVCNLQRR